MKHWLLTAVSTCALVAVAKLPPEPFVARSSEVAGLPASQEDARFVALRDDVVRAHKRLQRLRWSDSVPARLLAEARDGWAAGVYAPAGSYPAGVPDELRAAFAAELARIPARRDDVVIGAYAVDASLGAFPGAGIWGSMRWARETYLGERDGVTYCLNVEGVPLDQARGSPATSWRLFGEYMDTGGRRYNHLGACRWVAEFGVPGPAVHKWLRGGALALVREPTAERWTQGPRAFEPMRRRRFLFGLSGLWGGAPGVPLDACLAGLERPCSAMFTSPAGQRRTSDEVIADAGAFLDDSRLTFSSQAFEWRWVLADLYAEFGSERTRAFWTSPSDDVLAAFRDAFGVEAGAWVSTWVRGAAGFVPPGPRPRRNALAWSFAVLLASAAVGSLMGLRRTVA